MKSFAPLAAVTALLLLAACAPTQPTASVDGANTSSEMSSMSSTSSRSSQAAKTVRLRLKTSVSTDALATVSTRATLVVEGAKTTEVDLGTIQGELLAVAQNDVYAVPLARFTSWWAGAGDEIEVQRSPDNSTLLIVQRSGDESGTCTTWKQIAQVSIDPAATVELGDLGTTVEQSSLAFCDEPSAKTVPASELR